jgi:hypothetical protein
MGIEAPIAPGERSSVSAWPFIAGGVASIGAGIALFAIDQNYGHTEGGVRTPYYRNTTSFGVAATAVGVASLGVGVWFAVRHPRALPTLAIAPSQVFVGWSVVY